MKKFIKGFKKGQKIFADKISTIINTVLLSIVYFLGIGLTSIFAKICKKSFLDLKTNKESKTYWEDLNLTKKPREHYYRRF
jgi:hypothetical protein